MIYLDYNATTPLRPEVREAMEPFWSSDYGNASSAHRLGQRARHAMDAARETIAQVLKCAPREVIFTSGATEANNLGIKGLVGGLKDKNKKRIVVSAIEHPSALGVCAFLEKAHGYVVDRVVPDSSGVVTVERVMDQVRPDTALVCLMQVNNETGAIQPVAELGKLLEGKDIRYHVDAVQGAGKLPMDVKAMGCDTLSLSAHKISGPKGIGALYVRDKVAIRSELHGGHQENNVRPGTESPALVAGFARAAELCAAEREMEARRVAELKKTFWTSMQKRIPNVALNGSWDKTVAQTLNVLFEGVDGISLVTSLDLESVYVSVGSACASGTREPSHVILAMGISPEKAKGAVRFSFGRQTTSEELEIALDKVERIVKRLRAC